MDPAAKIFLSPLWQCTWRLPLGRFRLRDRSLVKDLRSEEQETVNVRMIKKTNIKFNRSICVCCSIVCQIYLLKLGYKVFEVTKVLIALRHVYIRRANFTIKSRFEIVKLRSFTWMNSQGCRVEKNTHAQRVQMRTILLSNDAGLWICSSTVITHKGHKHLQ